MPGSPSELGENGNGAVGRHEGFAAGAAREPPLETGSGGGAASRGCWARAPLAACSPPGGGEEGAGRGWVLWDPHAAVGQCRRRGRRAAAGVGRVAPCLAADAPFTRPGVVLPSSPLAYRGLLTSDPGTHHKSSSSSPGKAAPCLGAPSSARAACGAASALSQFGICREQKKTFCASLGKWGAPGACLWVSSPFCARAIMLLAGPRCSAAFAGAV